MGERTMHGSKIPVANYLGRRKQFEASEKERRVDLLRTMISDLDAKIADLDAHIATEDNRTRIKDTGDPAYSTFAKAAAKRRQNLLTLVAHIKSLLE
jgi:flagellar protein FliJ